MSDTSVSACAPVQISDDDIFIAMGEISGYIDITTSDFKELYLKAYQHALSRLTRSVKVGEIMTERVVTSRRDFPLEIVAKLMAEHHISGLPVVDESDRPIGIISERDFLKIMVGSKSANLMEIIVQCLSGVNCLMVSVKKMLAGEIMSSPSISVNVDDIVSDVAELFTSKGINRAPVVNVEEGRIIGIVTRGDLMRASIGRGLE